MGETQQYTLTRYLYVKDEILPSLLRELFEKNTKKSLFWAYEYYYSGFRYEIFVFLIKVYYDFYAITNPKLEDKIIRWICEWTETRDDTILGTIIYNLACRNVSSNIFTLDFENILDTPRQNKINVFCQINTEDKFLLWFSKLQKREPDFANELFDRISDIMKLLKVLDTSKTQNLDLTIVKKIVLCKYIAPHVGNLPDKCREPRLIIHCKDPHIIPYKTTKHNGKSPWKILRKNRIYNETEKHNHNIQYNIPRCEILTNWLFYASFSPVWEKRILKYGGNVDIENRKIIFETGEKEDLFQQHYGYDLDEQPAIFQPHDTALCREYNENIDEIACSTNNDYFS